MLVDWEESMQVSISERDGVVKRDDVLHGQWLISHKHRCPGLSPGEGLGLRVHIRGP